VRPAPARVDGPASGPDMSCPRLQLQYMYTALVPQADSDTEGW